MLSMIKEKKIIKTAYTHLVDQVKKIRIDDIFPFTETPSEEHNQDEKPVKDSLDASQLFSLFTADIIKKDVIFTR
jgi:hypothetical protein